MWIIYTYSFSIEYKYGMLLSAWNCVRVEYICLERARDDKCDINCIILCKFMENRNIMILFDDNFRTKLFSIIIDFSPSSCIHIVSVKFDIENFFWFCIQNSCFAYSYIVTVIPLVKSIINVFYEIVYFNESFHS